MFSQACHELSLSNTGLNESACHQSSVRVNRLKCSENICVRLSWKVLFRFWTFFLIMSGRRYLIGGSGGQKYRHFELVDSTLNQGADLEFPFDEGRCLNYDDRKVLACGPDPGNRAYDYDCWEFDGSQYIKTGYMRDGHYLGLKCSNRRKKFLLAWFHWKYRQ